MTIKVLQFICPSGYYGAERWVNALLSVETKHNVEHHLAITDEPGASDEVLKRCGLPESQQHRIAMSSKFDLRAVYRLVKLIRDHKIDIIHIHDPSAIALTIIADKLYNLPPFIFSKKTSFPIKKKKLTLYKYNYPKIKKIICVSNETKRIAAESIINKEKLMTIYDGTSLENKSSKTPFLIRKKYKLDSYTKVIGVIGNHIRAKHYETLIQVVDTIINKKNRKDFFFIQIGNFTDRTENLVKSIEELKMALDADVQHIVVDNFDELDRLDALHAGGAKRARVQLRITPGVAVHTHEFVSTGQDDSKFGFNLRNGDAQRAVDRVRSSASVEFVGIHCHIGSNVFAAENFTQAAQIMVDFANQLGVDELTLGGGLQLEARRQWFAPCIVSKDDGGTVATFVHCSGNSGNFG